MQERLVLKKIFFALIFAANIQERLVIKSGLGWRAYGILAISEENSFHFEFSAILS